MKPAKTVFGYFLDGTSTTPSLSAGTGDSVGAPGTLLVSKTISPQNSARYVGFATGSGYQGVYSEICLGENPLPSSTAALFALDSSSGRLTVKTNLNGGHHGTINFETPEHLWAPCEC